MAPLILLLLLLIFPLLLLVLVCAALFGGSWSALAQGFAASAAQLR